VVAKTACGRTGEELPVSVEDIRQNIRKKTPMVTGKCSKGRTISDPSMPPTKIKMITSECPAGEFYHPERKLIFCRGDETWLSHY
jgi:hypothetical protein